MVIDRGGSGLLSSRHLGVKITDFTELFSAIFEKIRAFFSPKRPQEPPLVID